MIYFPHMKKCSKCNEEKNFDKFYRDKTRKDGLSYYCKYCDNSRKKSEYLKDITLSRIKHKQWHEKNRIACNIYFWNRRAKNYPISGEKLKDIYTKQAKKCLYCKVQIDPYSFQIEHATPKQDESIVISCVDCNRLKWTRNKIEFEKFLEEYIKRFSECGQPSASESSCND